MPLPQAGNLFRSSRTRPSSPRRSSGRRQRSGRVESRSGRFSQRRSVDSGTPTARAACSTVRPSRQARRQRRTRSARLAVSAPGEDKSRDARAAFLITCPGRPKTCIGVLLFRFSQLNELMENPAPQGKSKSDPGVPEPSGRAAPSLRFLRPPAPPRKLHMSVIRHRAEYW